MFQGIKSIVLLSGGLDSAANLALSVGRGEPVAALTVNYGQKAWRSERRAVESLCQYYRVPWKELELPFLGSLGGSSLTDERKAIPEVAGNLLDTKTVVEKSADSVWVPNRNGVLIQLAAAWAEAIGAIQVVVGFNKEEAATFPDNTQDFLEATNQALCFSTREKVKLASFTLNWTKKEIVSELRALPHRFPFEEVWSCYYSGDRPCQKCESCQRFTRAIFEDQRDKKC